MTEKEMLIREVASAICRADGGLPLNEGLKSTKVATSGRGFIGVEFNEFQWQDYIKHATEAISAMKEFEYMANLVCPPA